MDQDKIGKFIKKLREEKCMNQEQLAEKLNISRQTISKWELGKSLPDALMIKSLSKIFKVSSSDIINGEKGINNEDITLKMYESRNKTLRLIKRLIILFVIVIILFLSYYFIISYNSIKVYTISSESKNLTILNGIFVDTNEKVYFQLGEINNKSEINILDITLYYVENDEKINVLTCTKCDSTKLNFIDYKEYNEYIDSNKIDYIIKNLYINVSFENEKEETLKLNFKRDFSNNKLFNNKSFSKKIEDEIIKSKNFDFPVDNEVVKKIKKHFTKKDDGYAYNFKRKNKNISAIYLNNELFIDIIEENTSEYWSFNFETNILSYELRDNKKIKNRVSFDVEDKKEYMKIYEKFVDILEFIFSN